MNLSTTKLIASLAAITTVVTSFAPVLTSVTRADSEEDMAAYEWAYDEAITTMTSYEKFMPFANLTREAAARFLVMGAQALGLDMESDQDCDYEDLDSADQTLVEFIEEGCAMGIFKAQENFNPKNLLTRAQAELTLARVIWGFDAVEDYADEYDLDEYEAARELLMDADIVRVEVDGQSPVLRLHLVLMLSRLTDFDFPEDCIEGVDCPVLPGTGDNGTGDDIEVKAGSIELSMASAPANFSSVPKIGVVSFGKFSFAAGSDDVNVRSVEVERRGLGARSDIQRIWFERNGVRVSGRASLTSDNKAVITFSPALVVKRNAAEQLELVVNLSGGDAGSEHMFAFLGVESSAVNATMNPSILTTPTLRTTTYTVANAEFQNLGTALTHRAGDINSLELGQFRLSNVRPSGSTEDKDIVVQSIKFRNISDGDVETSLANVALYRNSTKVSTEAMMDGKDITFVLNDVIKASENGVYYIRGDVTNVDNTSGDNYQFQLRNTEDLNVIEQSTRFRSTVTLGSSSSYTLANYKVEGGDVTFTRDGNLELSQTVSPGTNNVVLMRGTVTVKNPVTLEDLALTLNNNPSSDLVDRVSRFTLRIGNSSSTWTPSTTDFTTGTFDGAFTVNSSATFEITADIKTNATGGSIQFSSLEAADFNTVEYVNTQNSAKGSSVGSIASAIVTITPSTLNLTRTDGLSARSVVAGAQDVVLFGGRFSTTQNGSITINSFNLSGTASTAAFNDNVNTTLYVNGQSVRNATLRNGIINFNSLNIPVSKTAAANFEIKASINQGVTGGNTLSLVLTGVAGIDNNSQSVTTFGVPAASLTIAAAGSVNVSTTSTTPSRQLLVAGTTDKELARFNVSASNDNLRLTDIFFTNQIAGNANTGTDLGNRLSNVRLYDVSNMTTPIATATNVTPGTIAFENIDSMNYQVTPASVKTLVLKADINTVFNSGDLASNGVELALGTGTYSPTRNVYDGTRFVSVGNGQELTGAQTTVASSPITIANGHRIVRASIAFAKNPAQQVTTERVMQFTVTPQGNELTLSGVEVLLNGVSGSAIVNIYRSDDTTLVASGTVANNMPTLLSFMNGGENITSSATYHVKLVAGYTPLSINANNLARREFSITQAQYVDKFNNNGEKLYTDVASFNIGLPLTADSFQQ